MRFILLVLVGVAAGLDVRHASPRKLPAGNIVAAYANWGQCDEKMVTAARDGVNVVIWFSINLGPDGASTRHFSVMCTDNSRFGPRASPRTKPPRSRHHRTGDGQGVFRLCGAPRQRDARARQRAHHTAHLDWRLELTPSQHRIQWARVVQPLEGVERSRVREARTGLAWFR